MFKIAVMVFIFYILQKITDDVVAIAVEALL
jgi:hypothetical protein